MLRISVVFVLLYFCEGDGLFPVDISDVLIVSLWTSFPDALMSSSFTFF